MTAARTAPVVFVGGPFKAHVVPETGRIEPAFEARYRRIIQFFRGLGWTVRNAHEEEGWGTRMVADTACTARDFSWMRECDLFVAFPGATASPGTHVEIGWASALERPTVLLLEPDGDYAALVTGLRDIAPVRYVAHTDDGSFFAALVDAVRQLAGQVGPWWSGQVPGPDAVV